MRLSICIATLNRARFIGDTLDSIIAQMTSDTELIVVDGASTDDTESVVTKAFVGHPNCHYVRLEKKGGVDRDYDRAVSLAKGEFCWLMTDDDVVKPTAVRAILDRLSDNRDLVVVNGEWWNADLTELLVGSKIDIRQDKVFLSHEQSNLLSVCGTVLSFIGSVVIRRSVWLDRDREKYYGTEFIHVGVIFQSPLRGDAVAIADPLIKVRYGNSLWVSRGFQIWMIKWPGLIWSFGHICPKAKSAITAREPWKGLVALLAMKARGWYTAQEYRTLVGMKTMSWPTRTWLSAVAYFPDVLFNFAASILAALVFRRPRGIHIELRQSPFDFRTRWFGRSG